MPRVKKIVLAGLLLAVLVILARFVSVQWAVLRLSFGYIPLALAGWLLGPAWTAFIGAAGDLLGMLLLPKGSYFPGFTASELLCGLAYGFALYKKPADKWMWLRLAVALVIICMGINLFLNTFWLSIYLGKGFLVLLPGRVIAELIKLPIQVVSLFFIFKACEKPARTYLWTVDE
jgi:ECF transporter S component (folate family)